MTANLNLMWQIFYVHWLNIVIVLGLFAAVGFGFARQLAGATSLGRLLSAFIGAFWFLRMILQVFHYDAELRRETRTPDCSYPGSLALLVCIFTMAALKPVG